MATTAYHGRGIVIGLTTQGEPLVGYFAQGRSPPSRQRRLENYQRTGRVYMNVNSETSLENLRQQGGNPDLLLYNAVRTSPDGLLVVSNGFQTDSDPLWAGEGREAANLRGSRPYGGIFHGMLDYGRSTELALAQSLREAGSEADVLRTARIAAVVDLRFPGERQVGMVVRPRNADGSFAEQDRYAVRPCPQGRGEFLLICTYDPSHPSGQGLPHTLDGDGRIHDSHPRAKPGFPHTLDGDGRIYDSHPRAKPGLLHTLDGDGWIHDIRLDSKTPEGLVEELYERLNADLLVGAAAAIHDSGMPHGFRFATKNTKE